MADTTALLRGTEPAPPSGKSAVAKASVTATVLNLINNVVGAGLFSMPWVLQQSTILSGLLLLCFICVLNGVSFIILAKCCDLAGTYNYKKMGTMALGHRAGVFIQSCILLYTTCSCVSYVVLTGDFLVGAGTGVFDHWAAGNAFLTSRPAVMGVVALTIFVPLCLLKNLEALKYTSFVSFCSTCFAAGLLMWSATRTDAQLNAAGATDTPSTFTPRDTVRWAGFSSSFFDALPIVNVAFTAHYNGLRFYEELEGRSLQRFTRVIATSSGFCLAIYGSAALAGYLVFGSVTKGDVLENFEVGWGPAITARLVLSFVVICTFPLANHSLRSSLLTLMWPALPEREAAAAVAAAPAGEAGDAARARAEGYTTENAPRRVFLGVTLGAILVTTVIGVTVTKVETVLGYKGAIFGSCIVYVFPPLMLISLTRQQQQGRLASGKDDGDDSCGAGCVPGGVVPRQGEGRLFSMVAYGMVSGTIAVAVTIIKQAS